MTIIHKTAKGKVVDMQRLANQNELTLAVSNVKINARGDELGPGGEIIRKEFASPSGVPVQQSSGTHIPVQKTAPRQPAPHQPAPRVQTPAPVIQEAVVQDALKDITLEKHKGK
jgi:hypothetical protein